MEHNTRLAQNSGFLERFFKLSEHNTDVKTEVLAGITTFMTMAYILAVNPDMISATGMDKGALFTATALSAFVATLIMGLLANLPFALAPGMGLNAFFTFAVVLGMGKTWQFALTAVFLEGIIFILLTFLNVREAIINSIPANIKKAISVGIGLFIAFIGLSNSGIIVQGGGTILEMGNVLTPVALLTLLGVVIITVLLALNVKGALFIGIVATTLIGIPMGVTDVSNAGFFSKPPSLSPIMFQFEFDKIFTLDMFVVLLTFLFVDLFDTVGTLVGVCTKANMLDENGRVPKAKQALLADSIGTTVGAFLGTSTVTTYVESASGVTEGGRTGLTAVTTAIMFLLALILSPVFLMIPGAATAPALIIVGLFMMSPIKEIDFEDYTEALPAFITMLFMPLTYSIANGIFFGIISFVILKLLTKKTKDVPLLTLVLAIMFVIKIVFKF